MAIDNNPELTEGLPCEIQETAGRLTLSHGAHDPADLAGREAASGLPVGNATNSNIFAGYPTDVETISRTGGGNFNLGH